MGDSKEAAAKATKWIGLITSLLIFILGVVHVIDSGAHIKWPDSFLDDDNFVNWRMRLFTFNPEVAADKWTPIFFGVIGTLCHFTAFKMDLICKNFLRYFLFNLVVGLFSSIGYEGGLGIIFSCLIWVVCIMSLVVHFVCHGRADLELNLNCSEGAWKSGKVVTPSD